MCVYPKRARASYFIYKNEGEARSLGTNIASSSSLFVFLNVCSFLNICSANMGRSFALIVSTVYY